MPNRSKPSISRLTAAVAIAFACLASGCGKPAVTQDTAPFEAAIASYLKERSMGVKVQEFKRLDIDGDQATAAVSLRAADEEVAAVSVRWTFTFERDETGNWRAVSHRE